MKSFSLAANTIISTLGRAVGVVIALVTVGLTAGYLGQAGFGLYSVAFAFAYIFNYAADLGLYSIVARDLASEPKQGHRLLSNALAMRLVALVIFLGLAPLAALWFPYDQTTQMLIWVSLPFYFFSSLGQVLMGVFQRHLRTDRATIAELIGRLAQLGLVWWTVNQDLGVIVLMATVSISAGLTFGLVWLFARQLQRFGLAFDFKYWRQIFLKAWPVGLAVFLTIIYFKLNVVILSIFQPAADVGIYGLGYRILEALIFFPAMFAGLVLPILAKAGQTQLNRFKAALQPALNLLLIVTIPLAVFLIVRSRDIIALLDYEHQFSQSAAVLQILALAVAAIYGGALFSNALIALHRQRTLTIIYAIGAAANVVLNLIFIPRYSYLGASWVTVATEVLVTVLMVLVLNAKMRGLRPSWSRLSAVTAASIACGLALVLTPGGLWVAAPVAGVVYLGLLWLLGGLKAEEINFLKQHDSTKGGSVPPLADVSA